MPIGQGKVSIQRKTVRRNGWTKSRRARFLDVLGETANVTMAARAVASTPGSARMLKKRDGEFARLWAEAIDEGAERLREELLASQLDQVPSGDNPSEEELADARAATPAVPFDPATAIKVLQAHGGFGDRRVKQARTATQADVDAALMARLEALAQRKARKAAKAAERGTDGVSPEGTGGDTRAESGA